MPVHPSLDVTIAIAPSGGGSPSATVIIGLVIVVALLLRALFANAREMAGVAAAAIGVVARSVGTMLVAGIVLVLLVALWFNASPM